MITFLSWLPWLLAVGLVLYVLLAGLFALWAESEERRQEAERERFERIMAAGRPRMVPAKGPKGFDRSRRMG